MEWERVDGELPQNARVTGTLLTIYQVQPQDMGIYRCRASDRGQTVYVQVALEIQCEYDRYKVLYTDMIYRHAVWNIYYPKFLFSSWKFW